MTWEVTRPPSRGRGISPGAKEGADAAGIQGGDPAWEMGPEGSEETGSWPAGWKGPGRPKKSAEPKAADRKAGKELQPAGKRRPGRPPKKSGVGPGGGTTKKEGEKQAAQDLGERLQTPRRGRSRDSIPKE
jgi:hypothetical protein